MFTFSEKFFPRYLGNGNTLSKEQHKIKHIASLNMHESVSLGTEVYHDSCRDIGPYEYVRLFTTQRYTVSGISKKIFPRRLIRLLKERPLHGFRRSNIKLGKQM